MTTIATSFMSRPDAEAAIAALHAKGIGDEKISILMNEEARGQHFRVVEGNKAAPGAVGGGLVGGTLGALLAGLVSVGVVAAPGIGLVAAGPLLAALAGAGAGGASGSLVGGMVGLGIPEHEAKVIDHRVTRGGILVAVEVDSPAEEVDARMVLYRHTESKISQVG